MKTVISGYQATLILIVVTVSTTIITVPSLLVERAGRDAWVSVIFLTIYALLFSLILAYLCHLMGRVDLINFCRKTLGNIFTIPIALAIITVFLALTGTVVRETSEVLQNAYLTRTPLWYLNVIIILTSAILVYYGLESIARSLEVLIYIFITFFIFIMVLLINETSLNFIKPVLANGFKPALVGVYPGLVFFSEIFIILIFAPNLTEKGKAFIPLIRTVLFSGFIIITTILMSLLIFGPQLTAKYSLPLINLTSYVKKFMIIERMDPLFIFYWVGGGIFKSAIFLYVAVYVAQKLFNLKTHYSFIPVFIPPVFYISFNLFQNFTELNDFILTSTPYFLSILVFFPILLLVISKIWGVNFADKKT
ncbi:MAG: GerAB/ArcD/ProY family transporter [Halanaerobiales bacterium]